MTDLPLTRTYPCPTPKGPRPRKPRDRDAPAHYRLSKATWALILAEYREGATAPELALKWRVSQHALRKRITRADSTKRDWGDEQAVAQAQERAAAIEAARNESPEARAARLFDDIDREPEEGSDPVALARLAAMASGRALTGLAESYQRMAAQEKAREAGTLETLPLASVFDVCTASEERLEARFHISERPGVKDPDRDLKAGWWQVRRYHQRLEKVQEDLMGELGAHCRRLEAMMRAEGLNPPRFERKPVRIEV